MIPHVLLNHTATIKEYQGEGAYGSVYSEAYDVRCYFEKKRELVRDANGQEIVSSAQMFLPPTHEPPPKSVVTFAGIDYEVITSARFDNPLAGAKPHHTEVSLK